MGTFLAAFWRETSIVLLVVFIYLANTFYVDRIKLERDLAEAKYGTISYVLEQQSNAILESSETTQRIVKEEMGSLGERLERESSEQRKQIEELLKADVPDESLEALMEFLIKTVDDLRWSNE